MTPVLSCPLASVDTAAYDQAVADLLLTGDLKHFRSDLSRAYGPTVATDLYGQVSERILGSREARMVWRAVAYSLRYQKRFAVVARLFGLPAALLDRVVLTASDIGIWYVQQIARSNAILEPLTHAEERTFLGQLSAYAKRVAFTKLKFLACYDTSTDMEDYVQTLLVRSMTTIWRYAHFAKDDGTRDIRKTLNYAKAAIHNSAMSIIRAQTLPSRARIKNHMEACGTCPACLRKEPMQCYSASPAYEATTVSVESWDTVPPVSDEADEARVILARLISRDPRVAKEMQKTFGTTDVQIIAHSFDPKRHMGLIQAIQQFGVAATA